MFWCQNTHKTYSIVLMYICFCGATYTIMTRQFTMYGYALLLLELQTCFLSIQNVFFFSKMEANSNECPAPEALSIQLSSFEYVLVEQTIFFLCVRTRILVQSLYCICTHALQTYTSFI